MTRTLRAATVTLAAGLALAAPGCGDDDEPVARQAEAPPTTTTAAPKKPAPRPGTEVRLIGSDYGRILAGPKNQAIYLFTREKSTKPRCYGQCVVEWPPVLTSGRPRAAKGIDADLLGTTKRTDGKRQVTYNGHPLYYWYKDPPGEVLCQAVDEFGGFWYVVDADGDAIARR